jgi:hypothetical protein
MNCMVRNPAEHRARQAAKQSQRTCGFVLCWSRANAAKTQDLFLNAQTTAKTQFPPLPER